MTTTDKTMRLWFSPPIPESDQPLTSDEQFPGVVSHHPVNPARGELAAPDFGPLGATDWFPDLVGTEQRLADPAGRGVTASAQPNPQQAAGQPDAWFDGVGLSGIEA